MPDDKLSGVRRLSKSSVAIVVLIALTGVVVMCTLGKIDGTTAVQAALVLVGILAGKTAIEDGAQKVGQGVAELKSESEKGFAQLILSTVDQLPKVLETIKMVEDQARSRKLAQMRELLELQEKIEGVPSKPSADRDN